MAGIRINSNNFNGESVEITFNPFSGGTIDLGTQTIPYDYVSSNYEGNYSIYIPSADKTCPLQVGTAPTPTPSPTQTNTPTPTLTSTPTPTPSTSVPALDPDAAAYLADVVASGGTTDATIESAVDTLFTSLKSAGLYSKLDVMYPFVGGTASSHAINAKLNKSHDITWNGGLTHGISGTTGNATNGYGIIDWTSSDFSSNNASIGMYSLTPFSNWANTNGWSFAFGNQAGLFKTRSSDTRYRWSINRDFTRTTDIDGIYSLTRYSSSSISLIRNESVLDNITSITSWSETGRYMMFCISLADGVPFSGTYTNDQMVFFYIADSELNVADTQTLQGIINTFQTSLGRNTY